MDRRVAASLEATAVLLVARYTAAGSLREGQFETLFEEALASNSVRVLPGKNPQLVHWRKPFAIDMTAVLPDGTTLVAELKSGTRTLYNCAWDLAKLAVVLGEQAADHAYLVAGVPKSECEEALGRELFFDGAWSPQELGERFWKQFDFWAKDVPTTGPIDVPAATETRAVATVAVATWPGDWSMRAARVRVTDAAWIAWEGDGQRR